MAAVVVLAVALGFASSGSKTPGETLQDQFVRVVKAVSPAVVQIETSAGLGSGVIFDSNGDIVTNAHVVGSSRSFGVTLADGRRVRATLVGRFVPDDLAVIRIRTSGLHGASFASSRLEVGDIVLAVGNPLGLRSSVTQGIVSALGRTVSEETGAVLPGVVQTSAPINPGNSGGALVDLNGQVVGIPTLVALNPNLGGSQAAGIGFAIPSRTVRDIASQLIEHGRVIHSHRPYLGVRLAETPGVNGVVVADVIANGPAGKAGIRAHDVIVSLNGHRVATFDDLAVALAALRPGQQVKVGIMRPDGSKQTVTVTLGELPANLG